MFSDSDPRSHVTITVIVIQTTVFKPDLLKSMNCAVSIDINWANIKTNEIVLSNQILRENSESSQWERSP